MPTTTELRAANEGSATYAFAYQAVQEKAPSASGVYTIYTSQRWLYVGESDDVQRSLFGHLNEPGPCLEQWGPLSFSFEVIPAPDRVARQQTLITTLAPACNLAASSKGIAPRSQSRPAPAARSGPRPAE
jgi:hypothetical protein